MRTRFSECFEEGHAAYRASRHREAALSYAQAKQAARADGDAARGFQAGFWEVAATQAAGEVRQAYALLFTLLADAPEDAPVYERWLAEKCAYNLWCRVAARGATARAARLEQLTAFAARHRQVPAGDIPNLWADLAAARADWAEALRRYEAAWTVYDDRGYRKCIKADGALCALLWLGREADAARWLGLLGQTEQHLAHGQMCFHWGQARLALFRGQPDAAMESARRALEPDLIGTQASNNAESRHLLARLTLLLRPGDDPDARYHPARALLRQRPETGRDWNRLLILCDFRLAALRHALGVPVCDDLYYRQTQVLPAAVKPDHGTHNPAALRRRIARARLACAHLRQRADKADRWNECVWYGEQARARDARLDALVQAFGLAPLIP